jgi:hypothetical protein
LAYRDEGDEFETKWFVPLTNDAAKIKREIASLRAEGGGDIPEMVVPALERAVKEGGFQQGAMNRIVLVGDAPPHESEGDLLRNVGANAKAHYIQIDALLCGDGDASTKRAFETIAGASQGTVRHLAEASQLTDEIVAAIKERAKIVPVEKAVVAKAETTGSIQEAAEILGLAESEVRKVQELLVARGADVVPGIKFQQAWVKVRPGENQRLQLFVERARWQLGQDIALMLGSYNEVDVGKDVGKNASELLKSFLRAPGGENGAAALETKKGKAATVAERAKNLPIETESLSRGAKGAIADRDKNMAKIRKLQEIWRDPKAWKFDFAWVPVSALP